MSTLPERLAQREREIRRGSAMAVGNTPGLGSKAGQRPGGGDDRRFSTFPSTGPQRPGASGAAVTVVHVPAATPCPAPPLPRPFSAAPALTRLLHD
jgi:hypothetical protein